MEKYDIVVVGAGPAGLKTAEELAKKNKQVLILEKNKKIKYKVCGGGLTPKAMEMLPKKLFQRKFKKFKIHTPLQTTEIYSDKAILATINRESLHKYLAKTAVKHGAELRTNSPVEKIKKNSLIVNNQEIQFKYLIGADGSSSLVRKSLGVKTTEFLSAFQYIVPKKFKNLEIFFDLEKFGFTYVWIFPYKNTTSIGTGGDINKQSKNRLSIQEIRKNFDKWCKDKFDTKKAKFEASVINYDYKGFEFGNKYLVGDAAGFASGLTGEGIYFAMISGIDVAKKILNKDYECVNINHILKVKAYEEKILRLFELNKLVGNMGVELIAFLMRSKFIGRNAMKYVD